MAKNRELETEVNKLQHENKDLAAKHQRRETEVNMLRDEINDLALKHQRQETEVNKLQENKDPAAEISRVKEALKLKNETYQLLNQEYEELLEWCEESRFQKEMDKNRELETEVNKLRDENKDLAAKTSMPGDGGQQAAG
ncbi:nuclear distribution protein nudE-like 1-A [Sebastes umbrosus]|uniref:nuclear distribution protein nudE-like 1-A n=1 Tax=Sebastes umbrosus TaxID=72105 RepID=UPI00189F2F27|nr:nuclear distribution protein nudE-like 1-A [Sebastes umbrosus]